MRKTAIGLMQALVWASLAFGLMVAAARAQSTEPGVTATVRGLGDDPAANDVVDISFSCTGAPACTGTYSAAVSENSCSNVVRRSDGVVLNGLDLSRTGTFSGTITLRNFQYDDDIVGGMCIVRPGTFADLTLPYTASWDGATGTISWTWSADDGHLTVRFNGTFTAGAGPNGRITQVNVRKSFAYDQISASEVTVSQGFERYSFHANVEGTDIAGMAPPVVTGPFNLAALGARHNDGALVYNSAHGGWRWGREGIDFHTASRAELDSLFGNGTYGFTINGATVSLNLGGDVPSPPVLTLSGGNWAGGEYIIDPAQPLTIATSPFVGYGTHRNDVICIFFMPGPRVPRSVPSCPDRVQRASEAPGQNSMTVTYPAGTFNAGQEYTLYAAFSAIVDARNHPALPNSSNTARTTGVTLVTIKAATPVFPMTVAANIGPTISTATAQIQYRPEDVGGTGSVFTFALAPAPLVKRAMQKAARFGHVAKGAKDTPVECVLAQLNSAGELTGVSAASMQAYVTGILSGQGQAVTLLNNVPTANVAGATFYVGYGASAEAMLKNGVNRSAVTVPGSVQCKPEPPQTGWWWNTAEGGRGYSVEVQGRNLFFAAFHYDPSGRSTWHVATGPTSLDGSLYQGDLLAASGGQTLGGAYGGFPRIDVTGPLTLAFSDASHGTMIWPGGTVAIERFNIVPGGLDAAPKADQPESGWWWNPEESGRGFFMEWQNGWVDIAGYMYDDQGNPVWYLGVYETPNIRAINGSWWSYANGQSMGGAYKPATRINDNVAPVTVTFSGPDTALMTLPNGRTTQLKRHRF